MTDRDAWPAQLAGYARALALVAEPTPRAAVLTAWCNSWFAGDCAGDDVIDALTPFGTHTIVDSDELHAPLLVGIAELRHSGVAAFRLVLPVSGDICGLPGPPSFNTAAVAAGQVVIDDEAGIGIIPQIDETQTTWTIHRTTARFRQAPPLRPEEASGAIREALRSATAALTMLDVANDPAGLAARLQTVERDLHWLRLPPSISPSATQTAHSAARVLGILAIANDDIGATVTTAQAQQRAAVLADLAATARHALAAACSTR